jgi:polyhydroxybutyrate depolymerase
MMEQSVQYHFSCSRMQRLISKVFFFLFLCFPQMVSYAQDVTSSISFEGHLRDFRIFFPDNHSNKGEFPLVIHLHGYDWTSEGELEYSQLYQVTDTAGFVLVSPNAVEKRWNSGLGDHPDWPTPDVDDVGFINALLDTLIARDYYIDPDRIYVCGFSNGGIMSYRLACQLGHRFAAIASVSGLINKNEATNCSPDHPMPVLHFHGTSDMVTSQEGDEYFLSADQTMEHFAGLNNCVQIDTVLVPDIDTNDYCTVEKIIYSDCSDDSNILYYKVINGGHSWPGAVQDFNWEGARSMDVNAGNEIIRFFNQFTLSSQTGSNKGPGSTAFCSIKNYPNPFTHKTDIELVLTKHSQVNLMIIDVLGAEVATLVSGELNTGRHIYEWDATGMDAGVYFIRIEAGDKVKTKKCLKL